MVKKVRLTASKGILEDLLEPEELEDGEIHCGVQTKTTFVGTEGRVELHTVALVHLTLARVIFPNNAELDDTLGHGDNLEGFAVLRVLLEKGGRLECGDELLVSLLKLGLGHCVCVVVKSISKAVQLA